MRRRGFTFIEIMLVTAIFAGLSAAIFTCLSNGIKLWDRGRQLMAQEDVMIFLDRLSTDLHNAFNHSGLMFTGTEYAIDFPSVVYTPADRISVRASEGVVDQIGRVRYAYDPGRGTLLRAQANYSQALQELWSEEQIVVPSVRSVRFHYFYAGSKDPHLNVEAGDPLPAGVEIEISVSSGREEKVFKRYIPVPAGV